MINKKDNIHHTAFNLALGICLYTTLFAIAGSFFVKDIIRFLLGLFLGGALSLVLMIDMYHSVQKICGSQMGRADSYARGKTLFRALVFGVAVGTALYLSDIFSVLGLLLGIITLKLSAYTQPLFNKIMGSEKAGDYL